MRESLPPPSKSTLPLKGRGISTPANLNSIPISPNIEVKHVKGELNCCCILQHCTTKKIGLERKFFFLLSFSANKSIFFFGGRAEVALSLWLKVSTFTWYYKPWEVVKRGRILSETSTMRAEPLARPGFKTWNGTGEF